MQLFSFGLEVYKVMMKPQGSLHNQAVLSPIGMEVYLLQVLVGRGDEAVVVENVLGVWEQQAREGLIQFIGILEVTVILFFIETTYLPVKSSILLFYNLIYFIH